MHLLPWVICFYEIHCKAYNGWKDANKFCATEQNSKYTDNLNYEWKNVNIKAKFKIQTVGTWVTF